MTSNTYKIFEITEECIINTAQKIKDGVPVDTAGLQSLYDGIRILHHIEKMRNYLLASDHSDKSVGTSLTVPSSESQSKLPVTKQYTSSAAASGEL